VNHGAASNATFVPYSLASLPKMEAIYDEFKCAMAAGFPTTIHANLAAFLSEKPAVNQLQGNGSFWALLHYACRLDYPEVVRLLLLIPGVDVNLRAGWSGWTPLYFAVFHNNLRLVMILLRDARVDLMVSGGGAPDLADEGAFVYGISQGFGEVIKAFLAFREAEEMVPLVKRCKVACVGMRSLLDAYLLSPIKTRHDFLVDLGTRCAWAAERFAAVLLLSDGLFDLPDALDDHLIGVVRFLLISQRLPMELQMLMALRSVGLPGDVLLQRHFDPAILSLLS